jgi:hypothetical protein
MNQFCHWKFSPKDQKLVDEVLVEWFTASSSENILTQWENTTPKEIQKDQVPSNIPCFMYKNRHPEA